MNSVRGRVPCEGQFTPSSQGPELVGLPQAILCRCACGCRFRWPNNVRRHEQEIDTGKIEVFELSACPACGTTLRRSVTEPLPEAYLDEQPDVVKLVAEWMSGRTSSPPPASCERLRVAKHENERREDR